jgi:methylmalonyl-CoA mutase C-terminal domain/subunit
MCQESPKSGSPDAAGCARAIWPIPVMVPAKRNESEGHSGFAWSELSRIRYPTLSLSAWRSISDNLPGEGEPTGRGDRSKRPVGARLEPYNRPMNDRPIKVLIAKPGLDGHDRGAKVLARGLRDEGFEVVYTGLRQTPEMVVTAALQEDVDVVGLSILSGAHLTLLPRITALMHERGLDDVLVTAGGIIPDVDVETLRKAGVAKVFGPGTTIAEVAEYLRANARPRD